MHSNHNVQVVLLFQSGSYAHSEKYVGLGINCVHNYIVNTQQHKAIQA